MAGVVLVVAAADVVVVVVVVVVVAVVMVVEYVMAEVAVGVMARTQGWQRSKWSW